MKLSTAITTLLLPVVTTAVPTNPSANLAKAIEAIEPASKSCANRGDECRTAEQASGHLADSFAQYGLCSNVNAIAAVLALTMFESGAYRFNTNQQGHHGQGTCNMQSPAFNLKYAKSLPGVKDKVASITDVSTQTPDQLDAMLALVTPDEFNFGTGAWFLTTQCPEVVPQLAANYDTGFDAYMKCVGIPLPLEPGRVAYQKAAKQALGVK